MVSSLPYGASYFGYLRRALWMARPYAPEWRPVGDLGPVVGHLLPAGGGVVVVRGCVRGSAEDAGNSSAGCDRWRSSPASQTPACVCRGVALLCAFYLQQTPVGKWLLEFARRRPCLRVGLWSTLAFVGHRSPQCGRSRGDLRVPQPIYPKWAPSSTWPNTWRFQGERVMVPFRLGAYVSVETLSGGEGVPGWQVRKVYSDQMMREGFQLL